MTPEKILELHRILIKTNKIPKALYKHTSISRNLYRTLLNSELWFSAPTSFNDPFDCQINDQTEWSDQNIREYLNKRIMTTGHYVNIEEIITKNHKNPGSFNAFFTKSLRNILSQQGVSCFLPNPDNLLLWAHYSASHTGVCLKFDITEDEDFFSRTFPVKYQNEYPHFDYLKEPHMLINKAMLTKSIHWKYESEIRVFKDKFGNYPFKKDCLKEIIFGARTDLSEIKAIKQIVSNANYPKVEFRQIRLKQNKFDVEFIEI